MDDFGLDQDQLMILVIDDNPAICTLIADILLPMGHVPVTAESAEAGLEQLPYATFQVAFVDHNLPGMEGVVFGGYLRRNNPHMTLALVTADQDPSLERRCAEAGIRLIRKPFEVSAIRDVVTDHQRREAERGARDAARADPEYAPRFGAEMDAIVGLLELPAAPGRIAEQLVRQLKALLHGLRSAQVLDEQARSAALTGLLMARAMDVRLPRASSGLTLYEEYDAIMEAHGRRVEFGA